MEDNKNNTTALNEQQISSENSSAPAPESHKKNFGTIKPLTALQIISLMVPSNPASAGNCY